MDYPSRELPRRTKLQKAANFLMVSIFMGIGIYLFVQGLSQFLK